ncbi:hypothetical protein G4B88_019351 [Cannabis sativa]|uniref:Retrotransposon gag domain-containing protein n=1 Tax=Cannabis sativa TaxID=3483 RepID=A0A7J6DNJ6_CANSA|nr:hypothetical protein G4B88_019351 [Cannabis sativa]
MPNPEYESWIVHDQLLMGWLYGSMTEGIGSEVMGCRSAATLWTALEELYGAHSRANMDELRTKLQTTRKGDKSMAEYLRQKRIWADTLAIAGDPYPEKLLRGNILSGLDAEYLSIVVPLEARAELSWQELQSTLLSYDSRLERLQSLSPNSKLLNNPSAALAQKPFGPGNRGGFQGRGSGNSNNGNNSELPKSLNYGLLDNYWSFDFDSRLGSDANKYYLILWGRAANGMSGCELSPIFQATNKYYLCHSHLMSLPISLLR